MSWRHIDPTADQSYGWWTAGACMFCGDQSDQVDCVCRYCDCCSSYWVTGGERTGSDDGRPHRQDCPECVEWLASQEGKTEMERQRAAKEVRT